MKPHQDTFVSLAMQPSVIKRAAKIAFIVGIILAAINHGDAILAGDVSFGRLIKILLTFLVPYSVSVYSSVLAIRERTQLIEPK